MKHACHVCKELKECSFVEVPLCRDHYLPYGEVAKQNGEAAVSIVTPEEIRVLFEGERRVHLIPVNVERRMA